MGKNKNNNNVSAQNNTNNVSPAVDTTPVTDTNTVAWYLFYF